MGCPNGQDIVVVGPFDRQTWRRVTGAQPNRFRKEGAMLSTTVEPERRQRPFVVSYAMTGPGSGEVAAAKDAPVPEAIKVLGHAIIHPETDPVDEFGDKRANSPAVH
jgi:hypothetical protein